MTQIGPKLAVTLLISTSFCLAGTVDYLSTGQTGAQTQIDTLHTSSWSLTPSSDFSLGGGVFDMKEGQSASADVVLSLFQGSDDTGLLLASIDLTNLEFCPGGGCNQFTNVDFLFSTPVDLTTGVNYFAELTSSAPNSQSQAYFIKSGSFFISDLNGNAINPQPINGSDPPAVPEPPTVLLTASAAAACWAVGGGARRKMKSPVAIG